MENTPVSLTPEILEKYGFKIISNHPGILSWIDWKKGDIVISSDENINGGGFNYKRSPLNYVHELENLYLKVTNEELKIKSEIMENKTSKWKIEMIILVFFIILFSLDYFIFTDNKLTTCAFWIVIGIINVWRFLITKQ